MNVTLRKPTMSREAFLAWAERQHDRFEFDGFAPVAMTGGTIAHNRITLNLHRALHARLKDGPYQALGPDAGIATLGDAVRYPDAVIACGDLPGEARLVPAPVVVFEVVSATSGKTDRIEKPRECQAVPSILRYVIVELTEPGLTVLERANGNDPWTARTLTSGETLSLPEVGTALPVDEIYEGIAPPSQP